MKTQQALLKRIDESPHKQTCVIWGYRTHRKRGGYGSREFGAMIALRDAGVIQIIKSSKHQDCGPSFTDNWHETVISLAVPSDKAKEV